MTKTLTKDKKSNVILTIVMMLIMMVGVMTIGSETVSAADQVLSVGDGGVTKGTDTLKAGSDVNRVIGTAVTAAKTVAGLVIAVAVLVIVWAGFKYATSQGDPKATEGAKSQIIAAGVGMGISFLAIVIVQIFASIFGINGTADTATNA